MVQLTERCCKAWPYNPPHLSNPWNLCTSIDQQRNETASISVHFPHTSRNIIAHLDLRLVVTIVKIRAIIGEQLSGNKKWVDPIVDCRGVPMRFNSNGTCGSQSFCEVCIYKHIYKCLKSRKDDFSECISTSTCSITYMYVCLSIFSSN